MRVVGPFLRLWFRVRHSGTRLVPARGPAILAANHVSSLDGVFLALVVGEGRRRMTRFLAAAEFFRSPWLGWALRLYGQIPIRRGEGDAGALDEAVRTIELGALACVFPEGKVNPDPEGELQRGRTGTARIALATGAPVVPVGIWGTQHRWPHRGLHLRRPIRRTVALSFGEPMEPRGDVGSADDLQRFTELVMTEIARRVAEARAMVETGR